jgi:hypothetical protein
VGAHASGAAGKHKQWVQAAGLVTAAVVVSVTSLDSDSVLTLCWLVSVCLNRCKWVDLGALWPLVSH